MDLGARIVAWRKVRNITQRGLAKKIGKTAGAVCQWERGTNSPTVESLETLVEALGLTMAEFYGDVPKARAA
jgi:transcriptional regulator with XRE-family HTH domain